MLCFLFVEGRRAHIISDIGRNHRCFTERNNPLRLTCSRDKRALINCGNGRVASFLFGSLAAAAAEGVASVVRDARVVGCRGIVVLCLSSFKAAINLLRLASCVVTSATFLFVGVVPLALFFFLVSMTVSLSASDSLSQSEQ